MAVARNVVSGDGHAHRPWFMVYDPLMLIGSEVHGSTLGIVGTGVIGRQVAKRASDFDMPMLDHNRNRDLQAEEESGLVCATLPAPRASQNRGTRAVARARE